MIELLLGVLVIAISALFSFFMLWRGERKSRKDVEAKVRAHEILQQVESDIASGGDEYIADVLRKHTRPVRGD